MKPTDKLATPNTYKPTGPTGPAMQAIIKSFEHFDMFQNKFTQMAKDRFGSGWVWLCLNKQGELLITSTANQDTPISQHLHPILALDVWEHAYYLQYFNRRADYVTAWWNVVNWEKVEEHYELVTKSL